MRTTLLALGAPDWRRTTYLDLAADVVARGAPPDKRRVLDAFVARAAVDLRRPRRLRGARHVRPRRLPSGQRAVVARRPGDPRLGRRRSRDIRCSTVPRSWNASASVRPRCTRAGCGAGRRRCRDATPSVRPSSSLRSRRCVRRSSTSASSTASRRASGCTTAPTSRSGSVGRRVLGGCRIGAVDAVPPMADLSELVHVDEERVDALLMISLGSVLWQVPDREEGAAQVRANRRALVGGLALRAGGLSTRRSGR